MSTLGGGPTGKALLTAAAGATLVSGAGTGGGVSTTYCSGLSTPGGGPTGKAPLTARMVVGVIFFGV